MILTPPVILRIGILKNGFNGNALSLLHGTHLYYFYVHVHSIIYLFRDIIVNYIYLFFNNVCVVHEEPK